MTAKQRRLDIATICTLIVAPSPLLGLPAPWPLRVAAFTGLALVLVVLATRYGDAIERSVQRLAAPHRAPRRTWRLGGFLVAVLVLLILGSLVLLARDRHAQEFGGGWSPSRHVFDWHDNAERLGSLVGPVLNSFVRTPGYGDERAFFDARRTDQSGRNIYRDPLRSPTDGSSTVVMRAYVHNGANPATNESGSGVSEKTRIRIDLPTGSGTALRSRAYLESDNAVVRKVTDTIVFVDRVPFSIRYRPGSARLYNGAHGNGLPLPDDIVSVGTLIGYSSLDGRLPGGFEHHAFVEIVVDVTSE